MGLSAGLVMSIMALVRARLTTRTFTEDRGLHADLAENPESKEEGLALHNVKATTV